MTLQILQIGCTNFPTYFLSWTLASVTNDFVITSTVVILRQVKSSLTLGILLYDLNNIYKFVCATSVLIILRMCLRESKYCPQPYTQGGGGE